jgi:hypothetical protein
VLSMQQNICSRTGLGKSHRCCGNGNALPFKCVGYPENLSSSQAADTFICPVLVSNVQDAKNGKKHCRAGFEALWRMMS